MMRFKLIAGLCNHKEYYHNTRHNVGHWFIRQLSIESKTDVVIDRSNNYDIGLMGETYIICPLNGMNSSGDGVKYCADKYDIKPEEILIVYDDIDLEPGESMWKKNTSHTGGHKGVADVLNKLGSKKFHRLRIGVGKPDKKEDLLNYVLSCPCEEEFKLIMGAVIQSSHFIFAQQ